jgi:ribosome maturation factor RimP
MSVVDRVRELVEPLLAEDALELFDVEYGGGRILIVADRPGGVDLEALTRSTRRISALFDEHDPVPGGRYVLEVSSPGLERTLRAPAHFQRFLGAKVSVKTCPGVEGERRYTGTLEAADDDGFTVDSRRLAYAEVERVQTVFEWESSPRPARAAKTTPSKSRRPAKGLAKDASADAATTPSASDPSGRAGSSDPTSDKKVSAS